MSKNFLTKFNMKNYLSVLKSYFVFIGRSSRQEYWMFALFNIIFAAVAIIIDNILGTIFKIRKRLNIYFII